LVYILILPSPQGQLGLGFLDQATPLPQGQLGLGFLDQATPLMVHVGGRDGFILQWSKLNQFLLGVGTPRGIAADGTLYTWGTGA